MALICWHFRYPYKGRTGNHLEYSGHGTGRLVQPSSSVLRLAMRCEQPFVSIQGTKVRAHHDYTTSSSKRARRSAFAADVSAFAKRSDASLRRIWEAFDGLHELGEGHYWGSPCGGSSICVHSFFNFYVAILELESIVTPGEVCTRRPISG